MTNTTDFNNLVETVVSDLLDSENVLVAYNSVTQLDIEEVLTDLTGSTINDIATDVSDAGVDADTISYFEGVFSDFAGTVSELISERTMTMYTLNFKDGDTSMTGDEDDEAFVSIDTVDSSISGNDGSDLIVTIGEANNTVNGGNDDDFIANLGTGNNTLNGNSGADTIVNISTGNNTLNGGDGSDLLVNLGTGSNTLNGGNGADILINYGSGAALNGGSGNDILIGGSGEDTLTGGNGNDILTGGESADTFKFSAEYSLITTTTYQTINLGWTKIKIPFTSFGWGWETSGSDTLTDFNPNEDIIQIDITNIFGMGSTDLSFNSSNSQLSLDGNVIATLDGVTDFNVNNVEFI